MILKIKKYILPVVFLLLFFWMLGSCRSSKTHRRIPLPPGEVCLPQSEVPFPAPDFSFLYPRDTLALFVPYQKDITTRFTARDRNDIKVKDPKLFASHTTEIIDLSLLPENEFAFPLPGGKVISPYGGRRKHHSGADIKTCANDTIVSAFDGIVRMAKPYAAYGNVIVVRHFNGLETIYSHNSKNLVQPGDEVKAGQPIALTGRTGRATTEHLHFEVRINGQHFNPNLLLDFDKRELNRKCLVATEKGNRISIRSVDLFPHQRAGAYDRFATRSVSPSSEEAVGSVAVNAAGQSAQGKL